MKSFVDRGLGSPYSLVLGTSVVLLLIGLVMILSASSIEAYESHGSSFFFFNRQVIGALIGLGALLVLPRFDYHRLHGVARGALIVVLGLLVAVLIPGIGVTRGGSTRWIMLGPLGFQPSEAAKLILVVFSAHILDRKGAKIADFKELAVPVLPALGLVTVLILAQPDLGTALICGGVTILVMFLAGARASHLTALGWAGGIASLALIFAEGYRRTRLLSFLDPWSDPLNSGYQTIQGQIALGSGGLLGLGLGASRQKWSYVPNAHTDFIYAILGEELGLVGTLAVLLLFVIFCYLGVRIASRAPDRFGRLLAGGLTGWIGLQALINMGAVTGVLPITGVPLPLISFGGSSLVFTMAGIGLLLSVARRSEAAA